MMVVDQIVKHVNFRLSLPFYRKDMVLKVLIFPVILLYIDSILTGLLVVFSLIQVFTVQSNVLLLSFLLLSRVYLKLPFMVA